MFIYVSMYIDMYTFLLFGCYLLLPILNFTHNLRGEVTAKGEGESGPEYSWALIGLILDFFISWNCFLKFKEIARNNEKQE